MNKDRRQAAGRSAHDDAGAARAKIDQSERFFRMAGLGLMGVALAGLGGCTFVEQTEDLFKGGPEQRVEAAKQRYGDAVDTQQQLKQTHRELTEQQTIEERKLQEMRHYLESQNARLKRARENRRITEAQERDLHTRVAALASEIGDLEFRIQAARAAGETGDDVHLQERLQALRSEAERIEEEIQSLEE